jgi:hypothetical protein
MAEGANGLNINQANAALQEYLAFCYSQDYIVA